MTHNLYELRWPVLAGQYTWQKVPTARGPLWLLTWPRRAGSASASTYEPLQNFSGLFRTFAFTRPDRESILDFANRFGRLGCDEMFDNAELGEIPQKGQFIDHEGEPLDTWVAQIRTMRRLVRLWDLCMANDLAGLTALIQWGGPIVDPEVWYRSGPGRESEPDLDPSCPPVNDLIASPTYHPERLERFRPLDRFEPALAYVQQEANKHLDTLPLRLVWQPEEGRLRRKITPPSLKAALWLQFAEAIDAGKQYRACKACGLWFELSPEIARTSRHFCSAACRNRSYRERQDQARRLHAEGMPFKDIARELGTDVKTVKSWVKSPKA